MYKESLDISALEGETTLSQFKRNQLTSDVGPHPQTTETTLHLIGWPVRNWPVTVTRRWTVQFQHSWASM